MWCPKCDNDINGNGSQYCNMCRILHIYNSEIQGLKLKIDSLFKIIDDLRKIHARS